MKKSLLLMACVFSLAVFTGCVVSTTDNNKIDGSVSRASGSTFDYDEIIYVNLSAAKASENNSTWEAITTEGSSYLDSAVTISYVTGSDSSSTGLINVDLTSAEENIAVSLSGTLTTGGVRIQTNSDYEAGVYLNEVSINSSNYPCIEITKGGAASVFLSGTNTLNDGRAYGTGYGSDYTTATSKSVVTDGSDAKGTLYCKGSLAISGDGSLTVTEAYKCCIASKAYINFDSGTYDLTSTGKSAIYGEYGVQVDGGEFTINTTGAVSTSSFHKAHGIATDTDYEDSYVKINGGTLGITAYNGKGITSGIVTIAGGTVSVNSSGVTGYTNDNNKTGSYYDADGVYQENETLIFSAEGIEGYSGVTVSGGTVEITAVDDGINISKEGGSAVVSSGSVYAVSSSGDAIDSNGNIKISGGTIVACAPTGSEDGLDCGDNGYSVTVTGGLIASCSGSSNASKPSISGQKGFILGSSSSGGGFGRGAAGGFGGGSSSSSYSAGTTLLILDSSSTVKYVFTIPAVSGSNSSSYSNIFMTTPNCTSSGSYTVYKGGSVTGGTSFNGLYTTLPTVSSTGSSVSATSY